MCISGAKTILDNWTPFTPFPKKTPKKQLALHFITASAGECKVQIVISDIFCIFNYVCGAPPPPPAPHHSGPTHSLAFALLINFNRPFLSANVTFVLKSSCEGN